MYSKDYLLSIYCPKWYVSWAHPDSILKEVKIINYSLFFLIHVGVQLIYNVVLVQQQNESICCICI